MRCDEMMGWDELSLSLRPCFSHPVFFLGNNTPFPFHRSGGGLSQPAPGA